MSNPESRLPAYDEVNIIDRAHKSLHLLGWNYGEMAYRFRGRFIWHISAHRGEDRIIVRANTQAAAWDEALRQACVVQRDG